MLDNEMHLRKDILYFNLIMVFLLGALAMALLYAPALGAIAMFALFAIMTLNMIFAYCFGLQRGLIVAIVLTFLYGTGILYETMITHSIFEVNFAYVAWLFFFPISSLLTGQLSNAVMVYKREGESKKTLEKLVTIDAATGFYNAQGFFRKLDEEFLRAKRYKTSFSILLIKIANFSELQVIYGELNSTNILKAVSDKVVAQTRFSDIKALVDSDTLSIVLTETNEEGGKIVIEKLHRVLDSVPIDFNGARKVIKIKPSIGVACVREGDNDVLEVYERAKEELNYDKG